MGEQWEWQHCFLSKAVPYNFCREIKQSFQVPTLKLLKVHCYQVYCLLYLFRFNTKEHKWYVCNGGVVKSSLSYVFNNSETMAIKNYKFLITKQDSKKL